MFAQSCLSIDYGSAWSLETALWNCFDFIGIWLSFVYNAKSKQAKYSASQSEVARCLPGNSSSVIEAEVRRLSAENRIAEGTMSVKGKIYISEFDLKRLKELVKVAEEFGDKRVVQYLEELDEELDRADVVKPQEIPNDVITMNSTFRLRDLDRGEDAVYTLVFPAEADSVKGRISILAPIGTAVLGYRLADTIEWRVPAGLKRFKVEEIVYQPEAAGDYHR